MPAAGEGPVSGVSRISEWKSGPLKRPTGLLVGSFVSVKFGSFAVVWLMIADRIISRIANEKCAADTPIAMGRGSRGAQGGRSKEIPSN